MLRLYVSQTVAAKISAAVNCSLMAKLSLLEKLQNLMTK